MTPAAWKETAHMATRLTTESRTKAHRASVEISQSDLVGALVAKLGPKLTAFIAGRDTSTISRWKSGESRAGEDALQQLRVAYQVIRLLENAEADPTIRAWFMGTNPQLDDLSPAEALAERMSRETMAAARAFLAGG